MCAARLVEHLRIEPVDVVGTDEPESGCALECKVQKRLVVVTLDHFLVASAGPDRLTDPPDRAAGVLVHEIAPCGDDAGGVPAELLHVDKPNPPALIVQLSLDRPDL